MSISISNESKTNITVTNENKSTVDQTWAQAVFTWEESGDSTWAGSYLKVAKESKNSLTISNESKP